MSRKRRRRHREGTLLGEECLKDDEIDQNNCCDGKEHLHHEIVTTIQVSVLKNVLSLLFSLEHAKKDVLNK